MSLDLTAAFDCPPRDLLLKAMDEATAGDEDVHRLTQMLLAETELIARAEGVYSTPFASTVGTPQGDAFSPKLYIVYFEWAMKKIRKHFPSRPREDEQYLLPSELQYADDLDFISSSKRYMVALEKVLMEQLPRYGLRPNAVKTQRVVVRARAQMQDKYLEAADPDDEADEWKKVKVLGSLLGNKEDLARRRSLASAAFRENYPVLKDQRLALKLRLRVYDAYVLTVLLYIAGAW
jgi:hypothetical protein